MGLRPHDGEVAAGVDHTVCHPVASQGIDRSIDGKALGDAPEVDPDARMMEANAMVRTELDGVAATHGDGDGSTP